MSTYEVANTEKKALGRFAWKYLVIDEAHRLKNEASMFSTVSFCICVFGVKEFILCLDLNLLLYYS